MTAPKPKPGILDISANSPSENVPPREGKLIRLSFNESAAGASPKAIAAYKEAGETMFRYPEHDGGGLRKALAAHHGLDSRRIVFGSGSDELLALLAHAYLGPGDEALFAEHGFIAYRIVTLANGAQPVTAPERNLHVEVDALLQRVTERTKVVFLANPGNPTGTYIPFDEVRRLHAGLPEHVLLVLDAAYAEYVRKNDYAAGVELVSTSQNVVMTRTFSKIYGLAGLRIGWAYCPEPVADVLNRVRTLFNITAPAIAAGVAALADTAHVDRARSENEAAIASLTKELTALGLEIPPSVCNFLLLAFPRETGRDAAAADAFLKDRNIHLRRIDFYGLGHALRMTLGTPEENKAVVAALTEFLKPKRAKAS